MSTPRATSTPPSRSSLPTTSTSPVVVCTPADAVLAAPLMLGYWPGGSVCAIVVDADRRVTLVMRWDAETEAAIPVPPRAVAGDISGDAVHFVAYGAITSVDDLPTAPASSAWRHAGDSLPGSGAALGWVLVASTYGDRVFWTFVEGTDPELEVRVIPASESTRQAQRWGLPPWRATRSDYVADIAADPVTRGHAMEELRTMAPVGETSRDQAIAAVRDWLTCAEFSHEGTAEVLVALADVQVRDTVLWDLMQEEPSSWFAISERLARVVAAAPDTHVAAPATLLAILRWQVGDGSRASAAVERALDADPAYTLARLVDGCLATGMHPSTWRSGLADLSREACRRAS